MFSMDFADVGNPCILGMIEDSMERNVNNLIAFVRNNEMDGYLTVKDLEGLFGEFGIDYDMLPGHLKGKIDTIDILE